jgi:hypothetical protein
MLRGNYRFTQCPGGAYFQFPSLDFITYALSVCSRVPLRFDHQSAGGDQAGYYLLYATAGFFYLFFPCSFRYLHIAGEYALVTSQSIQGVLAIGEFVSCPVFVSRLPILVMGSVALLPRVTGHQHEPPVAHPGMYKYDQIAAGNSRLASQLPLAPAGGWGCSRFISGVPPFRLPQGTG